MKNIVLSILLVILIINDGISQCGSPLCNTYCLNNSSIVTGLNEAFICSGGSITPVSLFADDDSDSANGTNLDVDFYIYSSVTSGIVGSGFHVPGPAGTTAVVSITLPTNTTCAPITHSLTYDVECFPSGAVLSSGVALGMITVNPAQPTAVVSSFTQDVCTGAIGSVVIDLLAGDGVTVCNSVSLDASSNNSCISFDEMLSNSWTSGDIMALFGTANAVCYSTTSASQTITVNPDATAWNVTETAGSCGTAATISIAAVDGTICFTDTGNIPSVPACDAADNMEPLAYSFDPGLSACNMVFSNTIAATCLAPTSPTCSSVMATDATACGVNNGTVTVSGVGGLPPYSYDNGSTTNTTGMFTGLAPGTYTVTITDMNGCQAQCANAIVNAPNAPTCGFVSQTNVSCNLGSDGSFTVEAMSGLAPYNFDIGLSSNAAGVFTGLTAGTYTVTLTDAALCSVVCASVTITEPTALSCTAAEDNGTTCNGYVDGGATVTPVGGTPPYTYAWDNGENTASATMLSGGSHTVTVTDANNCVTDCTVTITEPAMWSCAATLDSPVSCNGLSDGEATVTVTNGVAPYTYVWDNGETTATATMLNGGEHFVTVTDMTLCETVCSVMVTQPDVLEFNSSACECGFDPINNNIGSNVTITGFAGGTAPYTLSTDFGTLDNTAPVIGDEVTLYTGIAGGAYTLTLTDANGCQYIVNGNCDDCYFDYYDMAFGISDPCACNDDQSENGAGDGTFTETVQIIGPAGFDLVTGVGSIGMDVPIGTSIPEIAPGVYEITFNHVDNIGYTVFVEMILGGINLPVLDEDDNQLTTANTCMYPVISAPSVVAPILCFNGDPIVFDGTEVSEMSGKPGTVSIFVNDINSSAVTEFDPILYGAGVHTVYFVFDGDFVDDVSPDGGITPANPGCTTSTSMTISIAGGESIPCNDEIHITADDQCEVSISIDMLLEGDMDPDFFTFTLETGDGLVVDVDDADDYIGDALIYNLVDICNGNSCWGYLYIEDKTPPEIEAVIPMSELNQFVGSWDVTDPTFTPGVCWDFDGAAPDPGTTYDIIEFTAPCDGLFNFTMTDNPLFDGIAAIYESSFDPLDPCGASSPIGGDDDQGVAETEPSFDINLVSGVTYYLVSSTWTAGQLGTYQWTFTGPCALMSETVYKCYDIDNIHNSTSCTPLPIVTTCNDYNLDYTDELTIDECGVTTIKRIWIASESVAGVTLTNSAIQEYHFEPIRLLEVNLPITPVELPCGAATDPVSISEYFDDTTTRDDQGCGSNASTIVVENNEGVEYSYPYYFAKGCDGMMHEQAITNSICNIAATYTDQTLDACGADCPGNIKVVREWTLIDWCTQETLTFTQVIKAADTQAPDLLVNPGRISVSPWGCVASGQLPEPEHLFDDCAASEGLSYTVTGPIGVVITSTNGDGLPPYSVVGAPKGEHTFVYTAFDCCGNSISQDVLVSVVDDTPPTAIALENIVLTLSTNGIESGITKLYPDGIDNGSHDGDCGDVRLEIRREVNSFSCGNDGNDGYNNNATFNNNGDPEDNTNDTDGGQFVRFCCKDLQGGKTYTTEEGQTVIYQDSIPVMLRVWDDGNCDGIIGGEGDNYNETWSYVRLEDKLPPILACPPDATIGCNMDLNLHLNGHEVPTDDELINLSAPDFGTGVALAAGACGNLVITYRDNYNEDVCFTRTNEITRTWCVEGTQSCCTQKIDIVPIFDFDPSTLSWNTGQMQAEITQGCTDHILEEPTWAPTQCELIGWSVETDTFKLEVGDACTRIQNNYTVINWCTEEEWTFTQTISVEDFEKPTILAEDQVIAVGADCNSNGGFITAIGDDNGICPDAWLSWQVLVDLYGDWTYEYEYGSHLNPFDPNFGTSANELYIDKTAAGQVLKITLPEVIENSKAVHRVVWKVSDGCENFTTVTTYFQVTDVKAPTPYCTSVGSALMEDPDGDGPAGPTVELWACDFDLGSYDNCSDEGDLLFTFHGPEDGYESPELTPGWDPDTGCEGRVFTCTDVLNALGGPIPVDVYVWDECGNVDFCTVDITLTGDCGNGIHRIAGSVGTEYGDAVESVSVNILSNQPEYPQTVMTDNTGTYNSVGHAPDFDYSISAFKNDDPRNGVSTLDIVLIQRHLLNLQNLSSAYQYIAADANSDANISAADLVDIRKLILEITDVYPNNDSWRFVDANQALTTANAFAFNETLDILAMNADMLSENWVAVKIGDVNGNAVVNANGDDAELRSGKQLSLTLNGLEDAEGIQVAVTSSNFNEIAGYQFTMHTNGLELTRVESGALEIGEEHVGIVGEGKLTMSWNTMTSQSVDADEVLFTLYFEGGDRTTVDGMSISSEVTKAEAYDNDLNILDVVLGDASVDFALYQNEPNPFAEQTMIEFSLPTAGQATLQVMDVTGKLIKQVTNTYAKGMNTIMLTKADLGVSGILYYTLETKDFTDTKKMIVVK